jgi:hypothetical protein
VQAFFVLREGIFFSAAWPKRSGKSRLKNGAQRATDACTPTGFSFTRRVGELPEFFDLTRRESNAEGNCTPASYLALVERIK